MMAKNRMKTVIIFAGLISLLACGKKETDTQVQQKKPVDAVYPLLDAANSRWFYFSSACRPFGMVNLSPDNQKGGAWGSGYRYDTDTIKGFSHIHAWQMSGVEVMPVTLNKEQVSRIWQNHESHFSHQNEVAEVGYHKVELTRFGVKAELTSTKRVGFHRYDFAGRDAAVVFDLEGQLGPSFIKDGSLEKVDDFTLRGRVVNAPTHRRPREIGVYFYVKFNQKVQALDRYSANKDKKVLVRFGELKDPLLMKVALSYTTHENAQLNMQYELEHWDFDQVVSDSRAEWNGYLSRVEVQTDDEPVMRRFYTDLWHALQGRRVISDVNGQYPDNTGERFRVGQIPLDNNGKPKFNHYNSDSFWGAQWTINTLWQLVYPEIAEEFCHSLLQYYKDGGLIPRGPSGGNYTYVMTGASSTPFFVAAWLKGIRGFDVELAYEGLKKNHMADGIMTRAGYEHNSMLGGGMKHYMSKGYVPYPLPEKNAKGGHRDGGGQTLEYAYQDWTLAQLAKHLGKQDDYEYFIRRAENYKNVFDKSIGWMRPKNAEGEWKQPYDPYEYRHGFVESSGAQMTWFVPHDLEGLAELMGGKNAAVQKLNTSFETAKKQGFTAGKAHAAEEDERFRRVPINYGNQPSMQTAFIFNRLGRPDLTQYWVKQVIDSVYTGLSPKVGFNGDEDQGLMGSLSVLMKVGLFQMTGAEQDPLYEITPPVFDQVKIKLDKRYYPGEELILTNPHRQSVGSKPMTATHQGQDIKGMQLPHSRLIQGGEIVFSPAR